MQQLSTACRRRTFTWYSNSLFPFALCGVILFSCYLSNYLLSWTMATPNNEGMVSSWHGRVAGHVTLTPKHESFLVQNASKICASFLLETFIVLTSQGGFLMGHWIGVLRFLRANFPDRCLFKNVLDFVKGKGNSSRTVPGIKHCFQGFAFSMLWGFLIEQTLSHSIVMFLLTKVARCLWRICLTHQTKCSRVKPPPDGYLSADVDGPPCVLWSMFLAFSWHEHFRVQVLWFQCDFIF